MSTPFDSTERIARLERALAAARPDEAEVETQWPALCTALREALTQHPCRYATEAKR